MTSLNEYVKKKKKDKGNEYLRSANSWEMKLNVNPV